MWWLMPIRGETSGFGGVCMCVRCALLGLGGAAWCEVYLDLGVVLGFGRFRQGLRVISGLGVLLGWKLLKAGSPPVEANPVPAGAPAGASCEMLGMLWSLDGCSSSSAPQPRLRRAGLPPSRVLNSPPLR